MNDVELFVMAGQAQDFILDSFAERDLVSPRDVGRYLAGLSPDSAGSERHFAVMSAIADLRTKGLVLFGDTDVIDHGIASAEVFAVPLIASLLHNQEVAVGGEPVVEKQNPFGSTRPLVPTARCLHMTGHKHSSVSRWPHVDQLLDELARVVHLGSDLGAAGLARAIVEEAVRTAGADVPTFTPNADWGLAKAIVELFDHLKNQDKKRMRFNTGSFDYSAARSTLDQVRCLGNAALHTAVPPTPTDLQLIVFSSLPRGIEWLSGASDPSF